MQVPGSQSTGTVESTVPERLAFAAFHLEEARRHCMEAASALNSDQIPVELQRDVLFNMDGCRDSLTALADFNAKLGCLS